MFDKEFIDESLGNKLCKLVIIKDLNSEKYVCKILEKYIKSKKTHRIGFDLEFNTPPGSKGQRTIAIFQIAFYINNYILIVFFNPLLVSHDTNLLFHELLISKNIIKIGHGTESLDIPALQNYLNDDNKFVNFVLTLYDTRFLCEFENILTGNKMCNIYYLLDKYQVIIPKQLEWLKQNEDKLGAFWNKQIDIKNLSDELRDYSMYDALYLKELFNKMKLDYKKKGWDYHLVTQITRFVFLLKRDIIKITDINIFNLFFLSDKTRLHDLFSKVYFDWINTLESNESAIFKLAYLKNQISRVFVCVYYLFISKNKIVFKTLNEKITDQDIEILNKCWKNLSLYLKYFPKIKQMIHNFSEFIKTTI